MSCVCPSACSGLPRCPSPTWGTSRLKSSTVSCMKWKTRCVCLAGGGCCGGTRLRHALFLVSSSLLLLPFCIASCSSCLQHLCQRLRRAVLAPFLTVPGWHVPLQDTPKTKVTEGMGVVGSMHRIKAQQSVNFVSSIKLGRSNIPLSSCPVRASVSAALRPCLRHSLPRITGGTRSM